MLLSGNHTSQPKSKKEDENVSKTYSKVSHESRERVSERSTYLPRPHEIVLGVGGLGAVQTTLHLGPRGGLHVQVLGGVVGPRVTELGIPDICGMMSC